MLKILHLNYLAMCHIDIVEQVSSLPPERGKFKIVGKACEVSCNTKGKVFFVFVSYLFRLRVLNPKVVFIYSYETSFLRFLRSNYILESGSNGCFAI